MFVPEKLSKTGVKLKNEGYDVVLNVTDSQSLWMDIEQSAKFETRWLKKITKEKTLGLYRQAKKLGNKGDVIFEQPRFPDIDFYEKLSDKKNIDRLSIDDLYFHFMAICIAMRRALKI